MTTRKARKVPTSTTTSSHQKGSSTITKSERGGQRRRGTAIDEQPPPLLYQLPLPPSPRSGFSSASGAVKAAALASSPASLSAVSSAPLCSTPSLQGQERSQPGYWKQKMKWEWVVQGPFSSSCIWSHMHCRETAKKQSQLTIRNTEKTHLN